MEVRFEPSGEVFDLAPGERLLDVVDERAVEAGSSPRVLPSQCRAAHCGYCRVEVLAGLELLAPPAAHERRTLAELGAAEAERLGCQLVLAQSPKVGPACVVLRPHRSGPPR